MVLFAGADLHGTAFCFNDTCALQELCSTAICTEGVVHRLRRTAGELSVLASLEAHSFSFLCESVTIRTVGRTLVFAFFVSCRIFGTSCLFCLG